MRALHLADTLLGVGTQTSISGTLKTNLRKGGKKFDFSILDSSYLLPNHTKPNQTKQNLGFGTLTLFDQLGVAQLSKVLFYYIVYCETSKRSTMIWTRLC